MLLKKSFVRGLFTSLALFATSTVFAQGTYTASGTLNSHHYLSPFVRLNDGRVFSAGAKAMSPATTQASSFWASGATDIFDPATGTATAGPGLLEPRFGPMLATLNDGRVAIFGGDSTGSIVVNKIELYDPVTNTISLAGYAPSVRMQAATVTLLDGRVLVVGGTNDSGTVIGGMWLLTFSPGGVSIAGVSTPTTRTNCTVTRLNDGRVVIAGGHLQNGNAVNTLEIFDPTTNTLSAGPALSVPRIFHPTTLMADGRVFISGGRTVSTSSSTATATCDIYNPVTNTITTHGMIGVRSGHWVVLLDTGKILISGAEVFDPTNSTFTPATSSPLVSRGSAAVVKLLDGRVFIGAGTGGTALLSSTEIFTPTGWTPNQFPVANAGVDQIVYVGSATQGPVTLNGSASSDPEQQPLSYAWSGSFGSASGVSPSVTLAVGIHTITLTVTDSASQNATATTRVAVVQGVTPAGYALLETQIQTLNTQVTTLLAELQAANTTATQLIADKQALQTQLAAANAQIATLTTQVTDLTAANQQLTQKNANLTTLLQSLLQAFDQMKAYAASINSLSDDKKAAINQALNN